MSLLTIDLMTIFNDLKMLDLLLVFHQTTWTSKSLSNRPSLLPIDNQQQRDNILVAF